MHDIGMPLNKSQTFSRVHVKNDQTALGREKESQGKSIEVIKRVNLINFNFQICLLTYYLLIFKCSVRQQIGSKCIQVARV